MRSVKPMSRNIRGSQFATRARAGTPVPPLTRVERDSKGFFIVPRKPLLAALLARAGVKGGAS